MRLKLKKSAGFVSMLLAVVLALTCLPLHASAVSQEEIDKLKAQVKELETEKSGYTEQLKGLENDMSAALERKDLLDAQIAATQEQVLATEEILQFYLDEIGTLEEEIEQEEAALEAAREKEKESFALYCERVRALEEGGHTTYWGILFGATSFSDMLSRIDFINEVLSYNEGIIDDYNALCSEITAGEIVLHAQLAEKQDIINEYQTVKAELAARTEELAGQRAEACEIMLEIENNQDEYRELIDKIEAAEDEVEKEIKKKEAELAEERRKAEEARRKAEEAKNGGRGSGGGGGSSANAGRGFAWPVSSRRITSTFGYRSAAATNGVGSTNHKGIDIGSVGYTTTVKAAKAGRVTIAATSSSYGKYVMIDHGDGSVTVYAHMSSLAVSAGQRVTQGQKIGVTGSTGHSTGPHLHFEIRINGNYVDPLKYLP